ncbi:cytochrome P450 4c21 [Culex quinquefasciatus]|uniref:Cytochrome P450 4c21 n=1 Tax=Culex quinquefasciatus TaxID=7176 RepID=B0WEV0_CULQU|nr:cytochrome P450 4c21 [Culex quinquefasciatus]|eukprot:XP_001847234.1 cytochrome P450 4c21 [Culex quinquefasciatus]
MLFAVLLSIVGTLLLVQYLKFTWTTQYIEKIPPCMPKSLYPLVGHIPMLVGLDSEGIFNMMASACRQVDRLGRLMIGPLPVILINHPETMEAVMTSEHMLSKPFFYDFMEVSDGIFGMRDGERWSHVRKLLNRTFNPAILKSFLPIMESKANTMVERLRPLVSGQGKSDSGIDILPYFAECTLEMIFNTTMGYNEGNVPGKSEYLHRLEVVMKIVSERMANVHQYLEVIFQMTEAYREKQACRIWVDQFAEKIVKHRRQQLKEAQIQAPEEDEFRTKSMIFLDQLLTYREGEKAVNFTDQEIMAHLLTMMIAGSDTSTFVMSTVCLFLAMHPEVQDKVVAEMNAVFSSDSIEICQDTLQQLRYTEQVIKETLRLAPVGVLMARETSAEVTLNGVRIPPNQTIMYNLYAYHRRKDIWGPDADQFDPDRFEPERAEKRHRYAFVPFLAGQRNCIGHRYAMYSMKIVLLRVLQEYRLWTSLKLSELRFEFKVSLHLVGPHLVWLSKRNK